MDPALKATDASGFVSSFFKIKTGKIGFYTVSFQFGTVFSIPIQFYTEIPITGVKVMNSPTYKSGPNTNTVVFGTMPSSQPIAGVTNNYLKCQVTGTVGANYTVGYGIRTGKTAALYKTGAVATNDMNYDDLVSNTPNWITFQLGQNVDQTDAAGTVEFKAATILDGNTDYEKTSFFCYVGDNIKK